MGKTADLAACSSKRLFPKDPKSKQHPSDLITQWERTLSCRPLSERFHPPSTSGQGGCLRWKTTPDELILRGVFMNSYLAWSKQCFASATKCQLNSQAPKHIYQLKAFWSYIPRALAEEPTAARCTSCSTSCRTKHRQSINFPPQTG